MLDKEVVNGNMDIEEIPDANNCWKEKLGNVVSNEYDLDSIWITGRG